MEFLRLIARFGSGSDPVRPGRARTRSSCPYVMLTPPCACRELSLQLRRPSALECWGCLLGKISLDSYRERRRSAVFVVYRDGLVSEGYRSRCFAVALHLLPLHASEKIAIMTL